MEGRWYTKKTTENFQREIDIGRVYRGISRVDIEKKWILSDILMKFKNSKCKEKVLRKAAHPQRKWIRMMSDFSGATLEAGKQYRNIF